MQAVHDSLTEALSMSMLASPWSRREVALKANGCVPQATGPLMDGVALVVQKVQRKECSDVPML